MKKLYSGVAIYLNWKEKSISKHFSALNVQCQMFSLIYLRCCLVWGLCDGHFDPTVDGQRRLRAFHHRISGKQNLHLHSPNISKRKKNASKIKAKKIAKKMFKTIANDRMMSSVAVNALKS